MRRCCSVWSGRNRPHQAWYRTIG